MQAQCTLIFWSTDQGLQPHLMVTWNLLQKTVKSPNLVIEYLHTEYTLFKWKAEDSNKSHPSNIHQLSNNNKSYIQTISVDASKSMIWFHLSIHIDRLVGISILLPTSHNEHRVPWSSSATKSANQVNWRSWPSNQSHFMLPRSGNVDSCWLYKWLTTTH